MIVDLAALEDSQKSFDFQLDPQMIELDGADVILKNEVGVSGVVKRSSVQTDVSGKILTDIEMDCSRCLQKIESSLEIPFEVSFVTDENFSREQEIELDRDELNISILEDEKIDFIELVREQTLLALPNQILCREDCRGLCRICGENKNLVNCKCEEEETDPRWAALKNLK